MDRRRAIMGMRGGNKPTPTEGLAYTLSSNGKYYICSGIGTATDRDIVIASVYEGLPVTMIANGAFSSKTNLTSVLIPNSITDGGISTFSYCSNLKTVIMSDNLLNIKADMFAGCSSLMNITIPIGISSIGDWAFAACSRIPTITIPSGVTNIRSGAFDRCSGLSSITVFAINPPTLNNVNALTNTNNCPIYVPVESVTTYQTAANWSNYASRIQAISN